MEGLENTTVTAVDQLATIYARPSERVLRKEIDHVDAMGRAFIAASPFLVLATGGSHGLDCSPKGDKPGFVLTVARSSTRGWRSSSNINRT